MKYDEYEFLFLSEKQKNIFTNNMNFFEDYYVLGFDTLHTGISMSFSINSTA
jgi:hypothetical protein